MFVDGDRLLIFLRFAVPRPYPEIIYGNSVCVELLIKSLSGNESPRNSSRSSTPSTPVDGAVASIPVDDLTGMDLLLIIREIIRLWNWGVSAVLEQF